MRECLVSSSCPSSASCISSCSSLTSFSMVCRSSLSSMAFSLFLVALNTLLKSGYLSNSQGHHEGSGLATKPTSWIPHLVPKKLALESTMPAARSCFLVGGNRQADQDNVAGLRQVQALQLASRAAWLCVQVRDSANRRHYPGRVYWYSLRDHTGVDLPSLCCALPANNGHDPDL